MLGRITRWLLLATTLTPLIVYRQSFYPFVDGKVFFFRMLVVVAFVVWAMSVFTKSYRAIVMDRFRAVIQNRIVWLVGLFAISLLVSMAFALEPFRAFWGDMERGEGAVGSFFYIAFFFLCVMVFDKKDWIRFFGLSVGVGAILLGYGGYEFLVGVARPGSLFGNSAYFAAYLLFAITSALFLIREQYIKKGSLGREGWGLFVLALLFFGGIALTGTRGALLGAVAALFVVGAFLAQKKDMYVWKDVSFRKIFLVAVVIGILCGGIFIATREHAFWQRIPGLDRVAQISFLDTTFQTRLALWDTGARGVFENGAGRMFFGWGPEHTIFFYNTHLHPESFSYTEAWFDRAHNKIIDVALAQGLVGLAVYLGIWVAALFVLMRIGSFSLRMIFGFFGISYFTQNIFLFDSVVTYLFFFATLAFVICESMRGERWGVRSGDGEEKSKNMRGERWEIGGERSEVSGGGKEDGRTKRGLFFGAVGLLGATLVILWVWGTVIPYAQAWSYIQAKQSGEGVGEFLDVVDKVRAPYTIAQREIRMDLFDSVYRSGLWGAAAFSDLQESADDLFSELLEKEQHDTRLFLNGARTLLDSWRLGNRDEKTLEFAQGLSEKAVALSPHNPSLYYPLIETFLLKNDVDNALMYARSAFSLNQDVSFSGYYLVLTLLSDDVESNRDEIILLIEKLSQDEEFMKKKGEEILEIKNNL